MPGARRLGRIHDGPGTFGIYEEITLLYFAYTARISPVQMQTVAPGAEFQFIAHLPEWELDFPIFDDAWNGQLPSARQTAGSTVWGAVFEVPDGDVDTLDDAERGEQRDPVTVEAMDRTGRRHQVTVYLAEGTAASNGNGHRPSSEYLRVMLDGSRHWSLPAGWIAGLEEHLGPN
ncbi:MAG: gamma-glutamylcyclotransferase [Acidimicrobiia bacterium]